VASNIWQALVRGGGADGSGDERGARGSAVQVDPMQPTLKPPGTKHLKLKCDEVVYFFAFNFKLCHYIEGAAQAGVSLDTGARSITR